MTQHSTRGGASAAPPREKVTFNTNMRTDVTLEFDPPSEARAGRFGDQFMYFLADNRIMWIDPPLHDAIVSAGTRAGDLLEITKQEHNQGNRRHIRWNVNNAGQVPSSTPRAVAIQQAVVRAEPPMKPETTSSPSASLAGPMTAALGAAMKAAADSGFAGIARPEDIRALAITIFIQMTGGKR